MNSGFSPPGLNVSSLHGFLALRPCVPVSLHPHGCWTCTSLSPPLRLRAWPCRAVDGKWQAWASWAGCSVTCGGGTQRRDRVCLGPFFGGVACQGPQDEYRQCSPQRCPGERPPLHSWALGKGTLSHWVGLGLGFAGECLPLQEVSWRGHGLPTPAAPTPLSPSWIQPHSPSLASWQSPMRSVMRTTLAL